jgi:hypothetical protein
MYCVVLSSITGNTPASRLDISDWNFPKNLQLADEIFNQSGSIDILFGADLFYEVLCRGRLSRPGNYPVLQETVLGWTVAGKTPAGETLIKHHIKHCFVETMLLSQSFVNRRIFLT